MTERDPDVADENKQRNLRERGITQAHPASFTGRVAIGS